MTAAGALDALGDATRREIVGLLARRPSSVQELADRLDPAGAGAVRDYLDRMWDTALDSFEEYVEASTSKEDR